MIYTSLSSPTGYERGDVIQDKEGVPRSGPRPTGVRALQPPDHSQGEQPPGYRV